MGFRGAAALLAILGAGAASADGPPLRVLTSSGIVVGDLPIARFERPTRLRNGRVVFRGVSTAVFLEQDGVERPYLRTGDALGAPLDGTLNEIVDVTTNAHGTIAVAADVNSSQATGVILVDDGAGAAPVVTHSDDPSMVGVTINAASDLLYWTSAVLYVRAAGAGASQTIGTLTGRDRLRLRPLLADGPAAAWMVERGSQGVSYWSPDTGTIAVAQGRFGRTARVRLGFALDARFGVAYLRARAGSVDGAFLWSVSSRETSTLARLKDRVGDRSIFRFRGPIAFHEDGSVVIQADLRGRGPRTLRGYVRAKDGVLELTDPPVVPPATRPHLRLDRRGALFSVDRDAVTPLVRPGDPIDGGGTVASVESHAARGDSVAAIVAMEGGGEAVVRRRGARLVVLPVEPDSVVALSSSLLDVTPRVTALLGDELVLAGRRRLTPLEPRRKSRFDSFFATGIAVAGDRVFVLGTFGGCDGIFVGRRRRLQPVLIAGPPPCGRRPRLTGIDAIAASESQLIALGGEAEVGRSLYRVQGRDVTRLGTAIAGSDLGLEPLAVILAGERPVFVADSPEDSTLRQVFLAGTPAVTPLLREGDPTAVGSVGFDASDVFGGNAGDDILVTATVRGGGIRRALLAQPLPR